jgi:ABC-type lipopolysaccharide export system ATPase subunit
MYLQGYLVHLPVPDIDERVDAFFIEKPEHRVVPGFSQHAIHALDRVKPAGREEIEIHVSSPDRVPNVVVLAGPNGAGKSTLMRVIAGIHPPAKGKLLFSSQNIAGLSPEEILRLGVGLVPEGRQIFAPLSVLDNLTQLIKAQKIATWKEVAQRAPVTDDERLHAG